jgi:hypothetical protein
MMFDHLFAELPPFVVEQRRELERELEEGREGTT